MSEQSKSLKNWNFDQLTDDDDSSNSKSEEDFFSTLKKHVAENVYFNPDDDSNSTGIPLPNSSSSRSTVRVDSSDLISRCRTFLPLFNDANEQLLSKIQSGENVRIELDSDDETSNDQQRIEMNLMFCPEDSSSSSSSSDDDDDPHPHPHPTLKVLPRKRQKTNDVTIVELESEQKLQTTSDDSTN